MMKCPGCGFDNPNEMVFCGKCGAALNRICQNCNFENPPEFSFCGKCATSLSEGSPREHSSPVDGQTASPNTKEAEAEHRNLTVLFCDLVGYAALSEKLDPEELRNLVRAYQQVCNEVVDRFEGHVAQYLGDGLLIYFGYPRAHEDDPQRAVRAGLRMATAVDRLNSRLALKKEIRLAVRIGIHTGPVVVGDLGSGDNREQLALGNTPNIASRLEQIADPGSVVIGDKTFRLTRGLFDCRDLGAYALKHISEPVRAYKVLGESDAKRLFDVADAAGLSPMVGREFESGLLFERWERAKNSMGQAVLLSGEAGIGKSRLVKVLKEHLAGEPHVRSECRCSPYHRNSALYPLINLIERDLGFQRSETPKIKLTKLKEMLGHYGFSLPEMLPLFASLLSIPQDEPNGALNLPPEQQKKKTLEALLAIPLAIARQKPLLFIVEDLHWIDPSTLDWLGLLLDQAPTNRIFVLLTFRPEFAMPWPIRSHVTQLTLGRLDISQVGRIIRSNARNKKLPVEFYQYIVDKADGVPLFIEELTKMVMESEYVRERKGNSQLTGTLSQLSIPDALQDSLMARLDRLGTAKEVAQLGSVLGREFSYELLLAVSPFNDEALQTELDRLVGAELLYRQGLPPSLRYMFKHALIQEAAYRSLLRNTRKTYHQKIAEVLEQQFPETADIHPELLAQHYTASGLTDKAVDYWQIAGRLANQRWAYIEAVEHLTKGLDLLEDLPESAERSQKELNLLVLLGVAQSVTKGWKTEVEQTYTRAHKLCDQLGMTPQLFPVLQGLFLINYYRANLAKAKDIANNLLKLAQNANDPEIIKVAHYALVAVSFFLGDLTTAKSHIEQGLSITVPRQGGSHDFYQGFFFRTFDLDVTYRGYSARVQWMLGFPDQALATTREALALAQKMNSPYRLAQSRIGASFVHVFRRERGAALRQANDAIALSTESGFPLWSALGIILKGWAIAGQFFEHRSELKHAEQGIAQIRRGLSSLRQNGIEILIPAILVFLAESHGKIGRFEDGIKVVDEAKDLMQASGARFYEPEIHRLEGELKLLLAGQRAEAEACFLEALRVARDQGAKSLELRAAVSLARLRLKQGDPNQGYEQLSEIYGWFTEGFDTPDLVGAKALLKKLSGVSS